jgi:hypothetical protein
MTMRRISIAAAVVIAALTYAGASGASSGFSVRSLKGVYGFSGAGTLGAGTIQTAVVGLQRFDGAGGCRITARLNAGGTVHSLRSTRCTYTVTPDGRGVATVTFDHPVFAGPFISDFALVDGGDEALFAISDPSQTTVASGAAKRQASSED